MALTYGFYNSDNGDRVYDAVQMSQLFDGLIRDGVFASIGTAFAPVAVGGLQVNIGIGRAWLNHTWTYNDAVYPVFLDAAEALQDRIDAIVIEVNASDAVRANSIKVIKGTPASTLPQNPTLINEGDIHQYPICYIKRSYGSSEIRQSDITTTVGTDELPFVTGILQLISLDTLLGQWQDELDMFTESEKERIKELLDEWQDSEHDNFNEWFEGIKTILSGDVAGELLVQISNLSDEIAALDEKKENKNGKVSATMSASKWSGKAYSFEDVYPSSQYDIAIMPNEICSDEQLSAFNSASILSSLTSNTCKALRTVPTVDIPIIIVYREKNVGE